MNFSVFNILVILALILTVASMIVPRFPFLAVAVLLLCVALIASKS